MTDVLFLSVYDNQDMHIHIDLEELDPPTGTVSAEGQQEEPFAGWLGLLRAISEMTTLPIKL